MNAIVVVEDLKDWPLDITEARVVPAQEYLTNPAFAQERGAHVFNLCSSYRYQSLGYYVSLLAAARGHKSLPGISTIVDFTMSTLIRSASDDLQELINKTLSSLQSSEFTLSIYFGQNMARRYERLCAKLFRLFPGPLMRCKFARDSEGWRIKSLKPISTNEIPEAHRAFVVEVAREFFRKRSVPTSAELDTGRFHLAILHDVDEQEAPSDSKTIARFKRAAEKLDFTVESIGREDYGRLAQFDALFIRETTNVNHHTFRFARRAQAEGLVVIDDPDSILRCSNKVFLAELLTRAKIRTPKTVIVHAGNLETLSTNIGLPCILKQPDSAFSRGVIKVEDEASLLREGRRLLEHSGLFIAQEFLPTAFDWRVGVLDNEPLFVCRYHMAKQHWQVVQRDGSGASEWGKTETLPLWQAPPDVVRTALHAASMVGDGLYGVDLKKVNGKVYVIEVNDNPDINVGDEDSDLKEDLYKRVMEVFLERVERRKERKGHR